jgi:hypothetical protein
MKEIVINYYRKNYRLQVTQVYAGESLSRYEVTAGSKAILLERRNVRAFSKRWKLISLNWEFINKKIAAEFINEIMVELDKAIAAKKINFTNRPKD